MNKDISEANGYNPDTNFNPYLCLIGTQGTIREDEIWFPENRLPFLNHYWTPWGDHDTWWADILGTRHAIEYARDVFDEGVMHFADGLENEAFFDLGRTMHLMEDMGSVPHVFSDSHPSIVENVNFADASGYEKWCFAHRGDLHAPAAEVPVIMLEQGMRDLALETFRSSRIAGRLTRDQAAPVSGDLAALFPGVERIAYVPPSLLHGHVEYWWLEGVGANFFGEEPHFPNREVPQAVWPFFQENSWVRVPNLPGEDGVFFYIENGQETVVPAQVWSLSARAWVPNPSGLTLAQLWAGAGEFRATPNQEHELIPRTTAYVAGYMKHLWDFVNPPPHLAGVRIEQDQDGDGRVDAEAGELIYEKSWRTAAAPGSPRTLRRLEGSALAATHQPARIILRFSEPVRHVRAILEAPGVSLTLVEDAASERGPPTAEFPDGEPLLIIPGVALSSLPDGPVTLAVNAQDLSEHVGPGGDRLDPDPSTRAGRLPDGSWRWYLEEGASSGAPDRTHLFDVGGFLLRARPALRSLAPGTTASHAIELRNLTLPAGTEVTLDPAGWALGWAVNADEIAGLRVSLPPPGSDWQAAATPLRVTATLGAADGIDIRLTARGAGVERRAEVHDWVARPPNPDHPDDLESVADPRFPTPWLTDARSPVGLLLGGWGHGLGHLLGRYGIATAPVTRDLGGVVGAGPGLAGLRALFVGSGGLAGIAGSPTLRERLADFVAGGGMLVAFSPQRGADLAALPGGGVAGFGWGEDQACFGRAVTVAGRHVVLSGQESADLDAGADGYLTRWPDGAQVLLRRTSNSQPAMVRYDHGAGEVFVLTLYPDFGYGTGQSSAAERALVRDLAAYALARPAPVGEYAPGDPVLLEVPAHNRSWLPTSSVILEASTPDRAPLLTRAQDLELAPGGFAPLPLALDAPAALGIHPVGCRLLDAGGAVLQDTADAAHFAVRAPLTLPGDAAEGLRIWVTAPSESVPCGGWGEALVHVRNATDRDFHGLAAATWTHLGAGPVDTASVVTVPARTEAAIPLRFLAPDARPFTLVFGLFEGDVAPSSADFLARAAAHAFKGFDVFRPAAGVELRPASGTILPEEPLDAAVLLRNLAGGAFPLRLALRLADASNAELWSEQREIALGGGERIEAFRILLGAASGSGGDLFLEARAEALGAIAGQAVARLRLPRARLAVEPRLPGVWEMGVANAPALSVRNSGELPVADGLVEAALTGPGGLEVWSSSVPVPPLAPGGTAEIALPLLLPQLPFGDHVFRYAASHSGGRTAGSHTVRHRAALEIAADPEVALPGGSVTLTVTARARGDVAGEGRLAVRVPALSFAAEAPVRLVPGADAAASYSLPIPDEAARGTYAIRAELIMAETLAADGAFSVPPARLEALPPEADGAAGAPLALAVANTGGSAGLFDYSLRLIAAGADAADGAVPAFAEVSGVLSLGPGEERTVGLSVPADAASGLYALGFSARDRLSTSRTEPRFFVFVRGLSATLATSTDRPAYAAGEPVAALARVEAAERALSGTTLRLSVTGAGGIGPPHFLGTIHVAPHGDDAAGDGSRERPFATPQRGIDAAVPGERVLLLPGTYAGGTVTLREGTLLQGEVAGGRPAAVLADTDVVGRSGSTVDHLAVRNGSIVFPEAASAVRVTDCVLTGGPRALPGLGRGIVFACSASDVLIGRNRLEDFRGERPGVQFRGPALRAVVHGNTLSGFADTASAGVHFWDAAREILVQENAFEGFAGGCAGLHFWGAPGATLADIGVLNNRFSGLAGNCGGVQLWRPGERVTIRGNRLEDLAGNAAGIHLWHTARSCSVSDNLLRRLSGDVAGIHLWGMRGEELLDVAVENNLLEDLGPSDESSRDNGILVWGRMRGVRVGRNVLRRVGDGDPAGLASGIVLREGGSAVEVSRNVVTDSDAGIALRPPYSAGRADYRIAAVVSHNLLIADRVGILEETVLDGGASDLRDNVVLAASRAGVAYFGPEGVPATSRLRSNALHANAENAEGRPDPAGSDGNFSADPLLVDAAAGDYRLLPGSPCADAGTLPPLDVGPLDDVLRVALGPRPVPPEFLEAVHWQTEVPVDVAAASAGEWRVEAGPIAAAGSLFLRGRLLTSAGQVLAESASPFVIRSEPVLLSLTSPRAAYRPGETIPLLVSAENAGAAAQDVVVRVTRGGEEVFSHPLALGPGETASLPFETTAEADCLLHAEAGLASADLAVAVKEAQAVLAVAAPAVAGDEPFRIAALVENTGVVPADLLLTLAGEAHSFTLAPGEERAFSASRSITADTTYLALLQGDASDAGVVLVRYGPRPTIGLEALPLYPAGPVSVPVLLGNAGSTAARVSAAVTLFAAAPDPAGSWALEAWLEAGGSARRHLALGNLTPGEYLLRAEAGGAAADARFRVAAESRAAFCGIAVAAALDAAGLLPVTVCLRNDGCAPVEATLTVGTPFASLAQEVGIAPGTQVQRILPLDVRGVGRGDHAATASLAGDGEMRDQLRFVVPLRAAWELSSLPAGLWLPPGVSSNFSIGVRNSGTARGAAALRVTCSDFLDETRTVVLAAGEYAALGFLATVPADLPGTSPCTATAELRDLEGGEVVTGSFPIGPATGHSPYLSGDLDRAAYRDGETATFVLSLGGRTESPEELRVLVSHGEYRQWREATRSGGPTFTCVYPAFDPDGLRLLPWESRGSLVSAALDLQDSSGMLADWDALTPPGSTVLVETRTGPTAVPDGSWTPWNPVARGGLASGGGRFFQYRVTLASAAGGPAPFVRSIRFERPGADRIVRHRTYEDFAHSPVGFVHAFPVESASGDQVFFGAYELSGRSVLLDAVPIRRIEGPLVLWADLPFYSVCDTIVLSAEAAEAGVLELRSPWEQAHHEFQAAGTATFAFTVPDEVRSGTYQIQADFLGRQFTIPVEVYGYRVGILSARMDRGWYLPGERARLEIEVQSNGALDGVTVELLAVGAGGSRAAGSIPAELAHDYNRLSFELPVAGDAAGPVAIEIAIYKAIGDDPHALFLAGASASFDLLAPNRPAAADAGPDLAVEERTWVQLDGGASFDPDGDALSWRWRQLAGPPARLYGADTAQPLLLAPEVGRTGGTVRLALAVSDGRNESVEDLVEISVADLNRGPVASAGTDATRAVSERAALDGSLSFDPDGDPLTFRWEIVAAPEGSTAALDDAAAVVPSFLVDVPGDYDIRLVVSDGLAESAPDSVRISTANSRPTADAGPDRTARPGSPVALSGEASFDPDGDPLGFRWRILEAPDGSRAALDEPECATPAFTMDICGRFVLELRVHDGSLESEADTMEVACLNARPVADAGPDLAARVGQRTVLDGGGSSDPDGDALLFRWAFTSRPAGSATVLEEDGAVRARFTPDLPGTYALSLVVDDGAAESDPDGALVSVGTDLAEASVAFRPAGIRKSSPPKTVQARIELREGFSSAEIAPALAAITAVGTRTLPRPVLPVLSKGAVLADFDRDGLPELALHFPVKPFLRYLKAGAKNRITLGGPLATWGRFVGTGLLRVAP